MSQVAIVGAGVAGLLCARDLNRLGIACTVFEKSRGLGGRLARRQHAWGELDIGAPFLTVQTPPPELGQLEEQGSSPGDIKGFPNLEEAVRYFFERFPKRTVCALRR